MLSVEVDQSGKIEDLAIDTVLAFSDGISRTIRIPASVKRAGLRFLRQRRVSSKIRYLRMLAAGFYLLMPVRTAVELAVLAGSPPMRAFQHRRFQAGAVILRITEQEKG